MSQHLALANRLDTPLVSPKIQARSVLTHIGTIRAPIAQLDRASVYETEGCKFESCWVY
jgi:hypothetical protein